LANKVASSWRKKKSNVASIKCGSVVGKSSTTHAANMPLSTEATQPMEMQARAFARF